MIEQGSASDSDYLLLDGFLARSGNLEASVDPLKTGHFDHALQQLLLYENLAVRQFAAGNADGLATSTRLDFSEDQATRDEDQTARVSELMVRSKRSTHCAAAERRKNAARAWPRAKSLTEPRRAIETARRDGTSMRWVAAVLVGAVSPPSRVPGSGPPSSTEGIGN